MREFLSDENQGLDVLVDYLSFTQVVMRSAVRGWDWYGKSERRGGGMGVEDGRSERRGVRWVLKMGGEKAGGWGGC